MDPSTLISMDPSTLIVTAITKGASFVAKQIGGDAVKDAYSGLKELLKKRFTGKPPAEMALTEGEKDPETWGKPLQKAVQEAKLDTDKEVLEAAALLLKLVDPEGTAKGKYNINIRNSTMVGTVIGDYTKVTQTFGQKLPEK